MGWPNYFLHSAAWPDTPVFFRYHNLKCGLFDQIQGGYQYIKVFIEYIVDTEYIAQAEYIHRVHLERGKAMPGTNIQAHKTVQRCLTVTSGVLLGALSAGTVAAEEGVRRPVAEISMAAYFNTLREQHPIFQLAATRTQIEKEQRASYRGAEDWRLGADVGVSRFQAVQPGESPSQADQLALGIGVDRAIWQTGGRLALRWDNHQGQFDFPAWQAALFPLDDRAYAQAVSLSYVHPLLKNRGGSLDRSDYEAAEFVVEFTAVNAREQEEQFLLTAGLVFVDWALLTEQARILAQRIELSDRQIQRIRKKRAENLVDQVDLLRAEDSRRNSAQHLALTNARLNSQRNHLAELAGDSTLIRLSPDFDLYATQALPTDAAMRRFVSNDSRTAIAFALQQKELRRRELTAAEQTKGELSLILSVALKGGGESSDDSLDLNREDASVGLRFSKPLGNRRARHQWQKAKLHLHEVALQRDRALRDMQSHAIAVLNELQSIHALLNLNRQQIDAAKQTTREEWRLYNQGRNDLATVILSQDREQLARFTYAQNAGRYQVLYLQLQSLLDALVLEPSSASGPSQSLLPRAAS